MPNFQIFKETAVPSSFQPNSVYLVAPTGRPGVLEIYVSDNAGVAARKAIDHSQVQAMIDAAIAAGSGGATIVDNIAARNALTVQNAATVFVVDASADATVDGSWASYIWRASTSSWIKTGEGESLDLVVAWDRLTGRPTSSPAQIDAAVTDRHTHTNKTQLDKVNEDAQGNLLYGGEPVKTAWGTVAW